MPRIEPGTFCIHCTTAKPFFSPLPKHAKGSLCAVPNIASKMPEWETSTCLGGRELHVCVYMCVKHVLNSMQGSGAEPRSKIAEGETVGSLTEPSVRDKGENQGPGADEQTRPMVNHLFCPCFSFPAKSAGRRCLTSEYYMKLLDISTTGGGNNNRKGLCKYHYSVI